MKGGEDRYPLVAFCMVDESKLVRGFIRFPCMSLRLLIKGIPTPFLLHCDGLELVWIDCETCIHCQSSAGSFGLVNHHVMMRSNSRPDVVSTRVQSGRKPTMSIRMNNLETHILVLLGDCNELFEKWIVRFIDSVIPL